VSAEGGTLFDPDFGLKPHQRTRLISLSGKVRRDHPDTSKQAARLIAPKSGSDRERVLQTVLATWYSEHGRTDEELQDILGMDPSTERPRRVELVEGGWLEDSGKRRPTRSGRQAIVWQVTDDARNSL
jgi:hypothetical protein